MTDTRPKVGAARADETIRWVYEGVVEQLATLRTQRAEINAAIRSLVAEEKVLASLVAVLNRANGKT